MVREPLHTKPSLFTKISIASHIFSEHRISGRRCYPYCWTLEALSPPSPSTQLSSTRLNTRAKYNISKPLLKTSMIIINVVLQACALSLLETSVFHVDVAEAVADTGPDLVDYCVRYSTIFTGLKLIYHIWTFKESDGASVPRKRR